MQAITLSKNDNREDFEGLYWVTKVPCDKSGAIHKTTIQVKDGLVMRTDGCRMHIFAPEADFEDGLYSVARRTKKEIVLIPDIAFGRRDWGIDWEVVFPDVRDCESVYVGGYNMHESIEFYGLCKFFDRVINYYFFVDVIEDYDEGFETIWNGSDSCPIIFYNDRRLAAVMPIRTK